MFQFIKEYPDHVQKAFSKNYKIRLRKPEKIIIGGMGGSAIAGDVLKNCLEDEIRVPISVVRDYRLPNYADRKTLVFLISYSGNTEESLSMLGDAKRRGCQIVLLTSGGKFAKMKSPKIMVPEGMIPRVALPYMFFPILRVLQDNKMIRNKSGDVKEVAKMIKGFNFEMSRQLAKKFFGRTPALYGPAKYESALYRWQTQINENSKKFAHHNVFTEMNHNEIVSDFKDNGDIFAVMVRDDMLNKRIKIHMDVAKKILSNEIEIKEVRVRGKSMMARLFYVIYLGDCTSYYLSLFRSVDPEPVDNIKTIKKALACSR